jgi:ubiquinone/menaquinone biosynthesis C-methylase UbiE
MNCNTFDYFDNYHKIEGGMEKRKSNKEENIEKINPNLFNKIHGIYVLKRFGEANFLPQFIKINGKICRKYLNIFYLHKTLSQLTPNQVISICDIRLENINNITSIEYNKLVISELIKKATDNVNGYQTKRRILDYGIGSGISLECLRSLNLNNKFELIGTDISKESLKVCTQKGINTFYWHDDKNTDSQHFDAIISSFVFDFNITSLEIKRLYHLLNKGGRLVLNLYKDDLINYNYVINKLLKAGFSVRDIEVLVHQERYGIGHEVEKVIIAEKF